MRLETKLWMLIAGVCLLNGCAGSSDADNPTLANSRKAELKGNTTGRIAFAERLANDYSSGSRTTVDSVLDVENAFGRTRNLSGTIHWDFPRKLQMPAQDETYGLNDGRSRRYSVSPDTDLVVHYSPVQKELDFLESVDAQMHARLQKAVSNSRSDLEGQSSEISFCNMILDENRKKRPLFGAARVRCIEAGVPDLVVSSWGAKYIRMTPDEQRTTWMQEGENWFKDGSASDAARCFEEAAKIEPVSEAALWKAAIAHIAASHKAQAQSALARFRSTATPEQLSDAASKITELEQRIAKLP